MTRPKMFNNATRRLLALAAGGMLPVLSGCDPTIRETLLTGIESATLSLVNAIVAAFFSGLLEEGSTLKGVQALVEQTQHWLA